MSFSVEVSDGETETSLSESSSNAQILCSGDNCEYNLSIVSRDHSTGVSGSSSGKNSSLSEKKDSVSEPSLSTCVSQKSSTEMASSSTSSTLNSVSSTLAGHGSLNPTSVLGETGTGSPSPIIFGVARSMDSTPSDFRASTVSISSPLPSSFWRMSIIGSISSLNCSILASMLTSFVL